ncbi:MAG: 30S ribosomal protein S17 [Candidatus Woykebacteria bacterium RBG_16_44_10]|uniref:Small ribosomal subunit protein uS17 n=1 Tax=Candidatus Woykebacteria bacterium RBG_16_44_10 TaxID=1802597 RepID=A0A1G1WEC5_9BACT|nr:MAG: 30S ribosomal protein S17 [Candidatus Woykebacteria bacterium RBG_16_44_10]
MELKGRVVSTKMQKTAVVEVQHLVSHPFYKKRIRQRKKFKAHDPFGVKVGDMVKLGNTKPLSRDKHFVIEEIVKK